MSYIDGVHYRHWVQRMRSFPHELLQCPESKYIVLYVQGGDDFYVRTSTTIWMHYIPREPRNLVIRVGSRVFYMTVIVCAPPNLPRSTTVRSHFGSQAAGNVRNTHTAQACETDGRGFRCHAAPTHIELVRMLRCCMHRLDMPRRVSYVTPFFFFVIFNFAVI